MSKSAVNLPETGLRVKGTAAYKPEAPRAHYAALPQDGFVRLPDVLRVFPVSRSAWWQGVREGRYPASFKLSPRCTAWRAEDIRDLIERAITGRGCA